MSKTVRRAVLVAFVIVAAGAAALAGSNKIPNAAGWSIAAAAAALLAAILSPLSDWLKQSGKSRIDDELAVERLGRTGSVLNRPVEQYDPVRDLGVHPAVVFAGLSNMPNYVPRSIDEDLDEAVCQGGLVIIEGPSASGKTRAAYEAIRRNVADVGWRSIIVPQDGVALRKLLESGAQVRRAVLWLDDLQRFIYSGGLDDGLIKVLLGPDRPTVLILATLRSQAKEELLAVGGSSSLEGTGAEAYPRFLKIAKIVRLGRQLDENERQAAAAARREDPRIAAALDSPRSAGLAENLAGAPAALDKWQTGRDGTNQLGAALISAAIDFQRAGYFGSVPRDWLVEAYEGYFQRAAGGSHGEAALNDAFAWATEPILGASACLTDVGNDQYLPFDYLVDHVQSEEADTIGANLDGELHPFRDLWKIPDEIWHTISEHITPSDPYYLSCVATASLSLHPGLQNQLHAALESGALQVTDFTDPEQMLGLGRSCIAHNMCVACQVISLGFDLEPYVEMLFSVLRQQLVGALPVSGQAIDALVILDSLSTEGLLEEQAAMNKALRSIPCAELKQLSFLLAREGRTDSAREWLQAAAFFGDEEARELLGQRG